MASMPSPISPGRLLRSRVRGDGGLSVVTKAVTVSPQAEKRAKKIISAWLGLTGGVCVCARAQYRLSPELSQLIESNRACSYWISMSDIDTLGVETVGPEIE